MSDSPVQTCKCTLVRLVRVRGMYACVRVCVRLCESVSRSKADVSSGEENPKNWLLYH